MAAANTDKFQKVGVAGTLTSLSAPGHSVSGTTITVGSTTNWPTDTAVTFAIRQVDSSGVLVAGTYTEWRGVVSGSTLTSMVLVYGTDQVYPAGSTTQVYIPVSAHAHNRMVDALLTEHDQDGTHGAVTASSVTATTGTFTNLTVSGTATSQGWTPLGDVPDTVTANGNRNYDIVFNGVDHTSTLSPGMKMQLTRTVAAPSQCTDLEASSSQSWSKASATGFSTGTTWTWAAKIKVESYGVGVIGAIDDGTNRLQLFLDASGRINISGGLVAGDDVVTSYASVPLNKWVDVTASITIGTPTGEIRLDDTVIASFVTASASTTMTIGTPTLYAGRNNAGNYFDGKIAQLAVYNAVIADATLKTYSSQTKTGSETSCKGLWTFNGNGNDSSSSANNLTANNSATATNADSPFANAVSAGLLEYAEVNSVTFSTNTTVNVRVPDTCQIPTSGGISAVSYSTQSNPYGLPFISKVLGRADICQNSNTTTTGSLQDIPGMSVTVYVPTNAQIRVKTLAPRVNMSAGGAYVVASREGSTTLASAVNNAGAAVDGPMIVTEWVGYTSTGSHTYKGSFGMNAASTLTCWGATPTTYLTTGPTFIQVELV